MSDKKLPAPAGSALANLGQANPQAGDNVRLGYDAPVQAAAPATTGTAQLGGPAARRDKPEENNQGEADNRAKAPRLPVSGQTKVNAFRAVVAIVAASIGSMYYGDESHEKVRVLAKADTPQVRSVTEQYKAQAGEAERKAKLAALAGKPLAPGSIGSGTEARAPGDQRLAATAEGIAGAARKPTISEMSNGKSFSEAPALVGSAAVVKAADNSHIMGGAFALAILAAATAAMRISTSAVMKLTRRRTMPQGATMRDGAGVTSLLYGYDTKEKQYMSSIKESAMIDRALAKKDHRDDKPSLTAALNDIAVAERTAEISPRAFPLLRRSQVEESAFVGRDGKTAIGYDAKVDTTIGEKLGIKAKTPAPPKSGTPGPN